MHTHVPVIRGNGTVFFFDADPDCFCCRYQCSPYWWFELWLSIPQG